jgi:hypothetical protein
MEKVQKPSNSVCYTPPSEPFRIFYECFEQKENKEYAMAYKEK